MLNSYEIAQMRVTSATALPDTCIIERAAGEPALNPITLESTSGEPETIYEGTCRVRPRGSQEQDEEVGELHETTGPYVATLPALSAATGVVSGDPNDVVVDDVLTVVMSTDVGMIGRSFRIVHVGWSSWQLDRRLGLQDRQQPQGIGAGS
jgi:hypothetical protein